MTWMLSAALLDLYASSHSSPELEAAFSAASSSDGGASAPSSGSPTPRVFWCSARTTDSSPLFPSGMTCRRLTAALGEDVLTWYLEGSHARTSQPPEREPAYPVRARVYGWKWRGLFARWSRDMCSWKTPPSLTGEGWTSSLGTLPRWGLMRDGELWERVMLVRRTSETESGFLPTPVKYDSHGTWESNNYHGLGWSAKNAPDRLDEKSRGRARMWPTPVKSEEAAARYTIETSHRHFAEGSHQVHLAQAARDPRLWPTPTAAAGGRRVPPEALKETARGRLESDTGTFRQIDLGQAAKAADAGMPVRRQVKYSTPTKTQIRVPPERLEERMGDRKRGGETTVPLNEQVMRHEFVAHRRMYATPIRSDATVSKGRNVLQMVADGEAYDQLARQVRREEMEAAGEVVVPRRRATLATPTSKNGLRASSQSEHFPGKWQSPGHPEYGELNPEWVEWIMGWPIGWTSLEPMDPARFEQWWALMSAEPETGYGLWWDADPSDFPEAGVPKTVKPKDTEENVRRVARIAALGNGQVSAVIPAQLLELTTMKLPEED